MFATKQNLCAFVFGALLTSSCTTIKVQNTENHQNDGLAFEQFKELAGTFLEVDTDGRPARIEYRLISRGSALTETWFMAPKADGSDSTQELTVFHMNNGALVATHYCAAGAQSTMALKPESPAGEYIFTLQSISNLESPDDAHNSGFGYQFETNDIIHRSERWTKSGKETVTNLTMLRIKD